MLGKSSRRTWIEIFSIMFIAQHPRAVSYMNVCVSLSQDNPPCSLHVDFKVSYEPNTNLPPTRLLLPHRLYKVLNAGDLVRDIPVSDLRPLHGCSAVSKRPLES